MNFPNTLSVLRIFLSPVFLFMFLSEKQLIIQLSLIVFSIAALTDWYDGWFARKYGFKTRWGRFLDPLADKILTSCAFIGFYILNMREPGFFGYNEFIPVGALIGIILIRDIILTVIRSYMELRGKEFKTSMISKAKTFIQMTYIFLVIGLLTIAVSAKDSRLGSDILSVLYSNINYYLLLFVTFLTAASGIAYIFESRTQVKSELV
jgi:CDP-diacylglycerol--glycerol-3-phosphate 3-phosphatidyltransferase